MIRDGTKGGGVIDTVLLFGKYRICKVLGTGRAGTVFLAVHVGLEEYRAVKRVPKSFADYERFRREALILKGLRHPGIPIVYDLEEDDRYSYLIEEYLEGESLFHLVKSQGSLSLELTVFYGIQLADIIHYLHVAGENPILHLDLQPKNLLSCHGRLKLIDFDHAAFFYEANLERQRYGTIGFAAPEQYEMDGILDQRTDLYSAGVLLYFMYTGLYPSVPFSCETIRNKGLASVIGTCLKQDREKRFLDAGELSESLKQLERNLSPGKISPESSLVIALAGSKPGAGVTHLAIGLSVYLRNLGFPNLYEEKNESAMGAALAKAVGAVRDSFGLMKYKNFVWKQRYGPAVWVKPHPYDWIVADYGTEIEAAVKSCPDRVVFVADSCLWSLEAGVRKAAALEETQIPWVVVVNHGAHGETIFRPQICEKQLCLKAPYFSSPFQESNDTKSFYRELMEGLGVFEKRKGKFRRWGRRKGKGWRQKEGFRLNGLLEKGKRVIFPGRLEFWEQEEEQEPPISPL